MKRIFVLICILIASSTVLAASWETSSLRTPQGGLVRVGMSRQEVLRELGRPQEKGSPKRSGKKQREVLTYRGEDGLYSISLTGGQVVKILVTPDRD